MAGFLRLLLVWLLLATLPMQALATAMRMTCVAEHGPSGAVEAGSHAGHDGAASRHDHAAMSAEEMAARPAPHDHADHPADHSDHHKGTSCGNCGACCIGAFALPALLNMPLADAMASVAIISPSPLVTGFIPDGLERPPRRFSA